MQYVRSISGSVSKTWNSINPATLSGAIDVIVVEHEDGTLACSPFHVRFGKFSLLRPYEKKVEFRVNNVRQDYSMKLGEGGEAFFVFETSANIPEALQTSPLVSPAQSPATRPSSSSIDPISELSQEVEPLDLDAGARRTSQIDRPVPMLSPEHRANTDLGRLTSQSLPQDASLAKPGLPWSLLNRPASRDSAAFPTERLLARSRADSQPLTANSTPVQRPATSRENSIPDIPRSPPMIPKHQALNRAMTLSKKLSISNIPSQVNDEGDLMLDMTGFKSSEEEALRAEVLARQILSEELEGDYDIASLIGADEKGNLWIYSSEEAKETAARKAAFHSLNVEAMTSTAALSDPGYQSDDTQNMTTPPDSPQSGAQAEPPRNYAKTLRLTSDQLKSMRLKPGANPISFSVNRSTCQAFIHLWKHETPIVISDIDGTITKSDALGHVLNMIGRDWTHLGVAKLYSDIVTNGYNILYLTSRSVGQADTTRAYISGIVQEGYRLPKGPVILSPDRTIAALRREVYLRKPEVFKMACLRDVMSLFPGRKSPFYAGFGNRLTDALSYRSVNIPSTRIFTINSNAEVSLDLLSLNKYKTGYTSMRETVDHFFPPVGMLMQEGGEEYTDFNYWRDQPLDLDELSMSESDEEDERLPRDSLASLRSEDEGSDVMSDEMADSYFSRNSLEESIGRVRVTTEAELNLVQTRTNPESELNYEADYI